MGLPKGRTNNTKGRPPDEKVKEFREGLRDRLLDRLDDLFKQLDTLKGQNYVDSYTRITKEVLPPLVAQEFITETKRDIRSIFELVDGQIHGKTG